MTAPQTQTLSAEQLIGALAFSVQQLGPLTQTIGGRISFLLIDDRPHAWILDLDPPGGTWLEGQEQINASLETKPLSTAVIAETDAFRGVLLENIEPKPGEVVVAGDASKLERLGELIGRSGNLIAQRARESAKKKPAKKNGRRR